MMRFAVLLLLLALPLTACQDTSSDAASGGDESVGGPALLFLGDSLTAGRGLAADEALPALIQRKLQDSGRQYRVINGGRSGDTTAGGLSRLGWYLRPELEIRAIVVGLGSNDAMRGLELAELERNLRSIVRQIRAFDPTIQIFLMQMYTFPNLGAAYREGYAAIFPRVARDMGLILIPFPLEGVAGNAALNQEDGIHPTAEGTEIVAENVWRVLRERL